MIVATDGGTGLRLRESLAAQGVGALLAADAREAASKLQAHPELRLIITNASPAQPAGVALLRQLADDAALRALPVLHV